MPTCRDLGIACGTLPTGSNNDICDVPDVRVGHCTLQTGDINSGVTAILPHGGNPYLERVPAAIHVGNGFGKFLGVSQVDELGELETPILLTSPPIRPYVRSIVERFRPNTVVMSQNEIHPRARIRTVAQI